MKVGQGDAQIPQKKASMVTMPLGYPPIVTRYLPPS